MSPAERDDQSAMGGLDRAETILNAFDETHRELTLAALVRRSALPRSTTHRTAEKMIRLGWLDKPADRYRIGRRLFEISGLVGEFGEPGEHSNGGRLELQVFLQRCTSFFEPALLFLEPGQSLKTHFGNEPTLGERLE